MRKGIFQLAGWVLAVCLSLGAGTALAAPAAMTCVYIPETGHNIHGSFLRFFLEHNGVQVLGAPLTEAFWEDQHLAQYFTNGKLEFYPGDPQPVRVKLGMVGLDYGKTDPPAKVIPRLGDPNALYFPQTGQSISLEIKDFYFRQGGADVFGFPISGLHFESGVFAQYFQKQRLEWNPRTTGLERLRTSPAGQFSLDAKYPGNFLWRAKAANDWCTIIKIQDPSLSNITWLTPLTAMPTRPGTNPVVQTLHVQVRLNPKVPSGPQYVQVFVDNQAGASVPGAAVYAKIQFAETERVLPVMDTNAQGSSEFQFDTGKPASSPVTIEVYAVYGSIVGVGRGAFTR